MDFGPEVLKEVNKLNIFGPKFFYFNFSPYLCTRLQKGFAKHFAPQGQRRAFSSAGLEHLPYKQRVGGSNPSTPTKEFQRNLGLFFVKYQKKKELNGKFSILNSQLFFVPLQSHLRECIAIYFN